MIKHPRDSNQVRESGYLRKHVRFVASADPQGERFKPHRVSRYRDRWVTHDMDPHRHGGMR